MELLKRVYQRFNDDEIFMRASSLAYYTALAIGPLVILLVWALSFVNLNLQSEMIADVAMLAGVDTAHLVQTIIHGAQQRPDLTSMSGWIGFSGLLISSSVIFVQLQDTLDLIFSDGGSRLKDRNSGGVKKVLIERLISMGMLLAFLFVAIVSLLVSSMLSYFSMTSEAFFFHVLSTALNYMIFSVMFALLFQWIPSRPMAFKNNLIGGMFTSLLFNFGRSAISMYLGKTAVGSAYGAAGSIVVLLAWVFYSAIIFFVGAEISYELFSPAVKKKAAVPTERQQGSPIVLAKTTR